MAIKSLIRPSLLVSIVSVSVLLVALAIVPISGRVVHEAELQPEEQVLERRERSPHCGGTTTTTTTTTTPEPGHLMPCPCHGCWPSDAGIGPACDGNVCCNPCDDFPQKPTNCTPATTTTTTTTTTTPATTPDSTPEPVHLRPCPCHGCWPSSFGHGPVCDGNVCCDPCDNFPEKPTNCTPTTMTTTTTTTSTTPATTPDSTPKPVRLMPCPCNGCWPPFAGIGPVCDPNVCCEPCDNSAKPTNCTPSSTI